MNFKNFRYIFIFGILVSIFLISSPATAPDPKNYGGYYITNKGDVAIYNITKDSYSPTQGYYESYQINSISLDNGSKFTYNASIGILISFTIINNTPSAIEGQGFFASETVSINGVNHTSAPFQGVPDTTHSYLTPGFKSGDSAKSYYAALDAFFTNGTGVSYSSYFENDLYFFITNETSGSFPFYTLQCWNWKNGWENSFHAIQYTSNGSIIEEYQENLVSFKPQTTNSQISSTSQVTNSKTNASSPAFTLLSFLIIPLVVVFYKKRKY